MAAPTRESLLRTSTAGRVPRWSRLAAGLAAALIALAGAASAHADQVLARDRDGRAILLDVRARGVDVRNYVRVLRQAAHGPEIRRVVVRILPPARVAVECGGEDASACYRPGRRRGLIIVPAETDPDRLRHLLLHEYGHHVDASRRGAPRVAEPNGTRRWWLARRMDVLRARGLVRQDARRGWARDVGEVFAEDYVRLNVRGYYAIPWLDAPSAQVLAALREDVTGSPIGPAPAEGSDEDPGIDPDLGVNIERRGVLATGQRRALGFVVRRGAAQLELVADLRSVGGDPDARAVLSCGGERLGSAREGTDGLIVLERAANGPARCAVVVANLGPPVLYDVALTIAPSATLPPDLRARAARVLRVFGRRR